jgi:hypothetical protein
MQPRLIGAVVAVAATAAAATAVFALGGGSDGPAANLWVDRSGGSCTREDAAAQYRDAAACAGVDAAWDAASAGDTIRVRSGTYRAQQVTGDKAAETFVIGERGTTFTAAGAVSCGYQGGALCANGRNLTLQHVTLDAGATHGQSNGAEVNGAGVTFRDVRLHGAYVSLYVVGERFTWHGGSLGEDGTRGGRRSPACDGGNGDGEPIWIEDGATGATIDGLRVNPQRADPTPRSCSANGFHLESIRIQSARDVTIRNVHFLPGSEAGSGHVFVTSTAPSATAATGLVLENNVFTPVAGTYALQANANVSACAWDISHNTMMQPFLLECDAAGAVWTGNLGADPGCTGTFVANVLERAEPVACGSNRYVAGDLGIAADGTLRPGSPAIDAAGRTCRPPVDFQGDQRPSGPACDAGADEL